MGQKQIDIISLHYSSEKILSSLTSEKNSVFTFRVCPLWQHLYL